MCKTNRIMCRICLSSREDDNISDSSCYTDVFNQFICINVTNKLFLCMWCKSILEKFVNLRKLAFKSENISLLQENMLTDDKCHKFSQSAITHTDISPHNINSKQKQTTLLNEHYVVNEDNNVKENAENYVNEVNMNLNEAIITSNDHSIHYFNEETELKNEIKTTNNENKKQNEMKNNKNKDTETLKKRKTLELRLKELKFEVKYLNLEEQMKEIEMKRLKYKDMKFQCELCGVGFLTEDYFEEHKIKHTEASGTHRCNICSLHFRTRLVLAQHTLAHRRQFICQLCESRVVKWSNCITHRQRCGADVQYVHCTLCNKLFSDKYSLKVHSRLHDVKRQFSCEHCAAQFTTKQRLIVHIRSHTGQKPFQCDKCNRCFSTNSNLKAHSSVHSDVSQYCVECNTHYKTAKSLKRHLSECMRHDRDTQHVYRCKQCSKQLSTARSLASHIARHNLTTLICPHCHKTFSNKSNLCKHLKSIHKDIAVEAKTSDDS